ncbi:SRT1 [Symbiodinium necroappetens]|uniref:Regulatory protein SIR2 homolog 7 n=1 Tax=Symbiodinium necroappetens TaxID=1628268 RepID=A0A813CD18_9DINO|nr:SRT1 [Symbiodinium necroappetens]
MTFHRTCWEQLLANRRSLAKSDLQLLQTAASTAEHFDAASDMVSQAGKAAEVLRKSSRAICFTGAGLSTAAGLGDYRGKQGKWTLEAQGADLAYTTVYEELRPTFAHEAIAKLVEMGKIAYVVSQNADGLHHLSGIPYSKLSDVHGSAFTEYCPSCRKRYVRKWYVPEDRAEDYLAGLLPGPIPPHIRRCPGCGSNHWTGRSCDDCGGPLHDTVISFGDGLEECVLRPAFEYLCAMVSLFPVTRERWQAPAACLLRMSMKISIMVGMAFVRVVMLLMMGLGSTMSIGPSNQADGSRREPRDGHNETAQVVAIQKGPLIVCVRQDTEMDTLCQASGDLDNRKPDQCAQPARFMHHVMLALLGEEQFKDWEVPLLRGHFTLQVSPTQQLKAKASLSEKRALYNSQRPSVGKQRGDIFAAWLDILTLDPASCRISSSEAECFEH